MSTNQPTATLTQENVGVVATTVYPPEPLWKRVKNLATERRCSAQSIWVAAMQEYLDRQAQKTDAT